MAEKLSQRLARDEIATCHPVMMEALHRARDGREFEALFSQLFEPLHWLPAGRLVFKRAFDVQRTMAAVTDGNHRRPAIDYLIAACAELAGPDVVLWAFDKDLRVICTHTRQPYEDESRQHPA